MSETSLQQSREERARLEVGQTTVGRGVAWLLVAQFLLAVGGVLMSEIVQRDNLGRRLTRLADVDVVPPDGLLERNGALIEKLERFEDEAEEER